MTEKIKLEYIIGNSGMLLELHIYQSVFHSKQNKTFVMSIIITFVMIPNIAIIECALALLISNMTYSSTILVCTVCNSLLEFEHLHDDAARRFRKYGVSSKTVIITLYRKEDTIIYTICICVSDKFTRRCTWSV